MIKSNYNIEDLVNEHLGNLVKFNIGMVDNNYEFVVVYQDDYNLKNEYSFRYNKDNAETQFGGNVSKTRFSNFKFERNIDFEDSLVENFICAS